MWERNFPAFPETATVSFPSPENIQGVSDRQLNVGSIPVEESFLEAKPKPAASNLVLTFSRTQTEHTALPPDSLDNAKVP